jgi:hypothetical protein
MKLIERKDAGHIGVLAHQRDHVVFEGKWFSARRENHAIAPGAGGGF